MITYCKITGSKLLILNGSNPQYTQIIKTNSGNWLTEYDEYYDRKGNFLAFARDGAFNHAKKSWGRKICWALNSALENINWTYVKVNPKEIDIVKKEIRTPKNPNLSSDGGDYYEWEIIHKYKNFQWTTYDTSFVGQYDHLTGQYTYPTHRIEVIGIDIKNKTIYILYSVKTTQDEYIYFYLNLIK